MPDIPMHDGTVVLVYAPSIVYRHDPHILGRDWQLTVDSGPLVLRNWELGPCIAELGASWALGTIWTLGT